MTLKHIFSNTLIISVIFITGVSVADTTEPVKAPMIVIENEPNLNIDQDESHGIISFKATLTDQCGLEEFGNINFNYNKANKSARIESLLIRPDHRKKSFGSMLLTFALQTLTECKCTIVTWMACPFNLRDGETTREMLPKLLAFYQRHGGIVTYMREYNADIAYYPRVRKSEINQSSIS